MKSKTSQLLLVVILQVLIAFCPRVSAEPNFVIAEAQELNLSLKNRFLMEITILQMKNPEIPKHIIDPVGKLRRKDYFDYLTEVQLQLMALSKICDYSKVNGSKTLVEKQLQCIAAQQDYALLLQQAKILSPKK